MKTNKLLRIDEVWNSDQIGPWHDFVHTKKYNMSTKAQSNVCAIEIMASWKNSTFSNFF